MWGDQLGARSQAAEIRALDSFNLYGRTPGIAEIDRRPSDNPGERSHIEAIEEQKNIAQAQRSSAGR